MALSGISFEANGNQPLVVRPEVAERLVQPVSLLLVTVKAPQLEDALERVEPEAVADGVVLPLLNGLEHIEPLRERFGGRVAAGSLSRFEAYRPGRMQIIQKSHTALVTMASESLSGRELERAGDVLRQAGVDVEFETDEKRVLWRKAVRLAVLAPATALTRKSVGELRDGPRVASTHGAGDHRGLRHRHGRRREPDALRTVDANHRDGARPYDLGCTGRRRRAPLRDRRDHRRRRPRRRTTRGSLSGAHGPRPSNHRALER